MWKYWVFLTDLKQSEIDDLQADVAGKLHPMEVKKRLARTITAGFHGEDAARSADENWARMFQQKGESEDLEEVDIAFADVTAANEAGALHVRVPKLLAALGLAASASEANRKIAEKAVKINGEVVASNVLTLDDMPARLTVRLGKRAKVAIIGNVGEGV
jgi:tyrosyl-tRNA synthetase